MNKSKANKQQESQASLQDPGKDFSHKAEQCDTIINLFCVQYLHTFSVCN